MKICIDKSIEIMSHEEDYDENEHLTLFEITLSNLKNIKWRCKRNRFYSQSNLIMLTWNDSNDYKF